MKIWGGLQMLIAVKRGGADGRVVFRISGMDDAISIAYETGGEELREIHKRINFRVTDADTA